MSSILNILDNLADALEAKGCLKEASEIDVISNTLEQSGMKRDPESVLQAMKALGTKQQVAEFLRNIAKGAPDKFNKFVDEILELAKNVPLSGLGKSASDEETA